MANLKRIADALERIAAAMEVKPVGLPESSVLDRRIGGRGMPTMAKNALISEFGDELTYRRLIEFTGMRLLEIRQFGAGSLMMLREHLEDLGLKLRGD